MELTNGFIRLTNSEPLTLKCSALADFLWDDFIREARATVRYFIDRYNIKQLSRFGKEIFERLYSGDNVEWLISLDEYETYFREVQNTGSATLPPAYKPENGFWWAIMSDLGEAAAWPDLLERCVGDQFNSGNNAVSILNQLSKLIDEAIQTNAELLNMLRGAGEQLENLRQEFRDAKAKGDDKKAAEARAKGKELVQQINDIIQQTRQEVQSGLDDVIDKTIKESDELNQAMSNMWGTAEGKGSKTGNLEEKRKLADKLKKNYTLKEISKKLGALRRVWTERKRARKLKDNYASIVGATFSNDVTRTFATELALAGTNEGRALFAMKYSQKTLLTKDYEAHTKHIGKGPIVMYLDVSGSMQGDRDLWCKAIALVIAEEAVKENREVQINLFDVSIKDSIDLEPNRPNNKELLDFVCDWTLGGGTLFNSVLLHAGSNAAIKDKTDVLMITDGRSDVTDPAVKAVNKLKEQTGSQWYTICIDKDDASVCNRFSDEVYKVNIHDQAKTVDVIQRCVL